MLFADLHVAISKSRSLPCIGVVQLNILFSIWVDNEMLSYESGLICLRQTEVSSLASPIWTIIEIKGANYYYGHFDFNLHSHSANNHALLVVLDLDWGWILFWMKNSLPLVGCFCCLSFAYKWTFLTQCLRFSVSMDGWCITLFQLKLNLCVKC